MSGTLLIDDHRTVTLPIIQVIPFVLHIRTQPKGREGGWIPCFFLLQNHNSAPEPQPPTEGSIRFGRRNTKPCFIPKGNPKSGTLSELSRILYIARLSHHLPSLPVPHTKLYLSITITWIASTSGSRAES